MLSSATPGALWRRALEALAHAFDPAREAGLAREAEDTVFQTAPARERAEPRREDEDPLQPPRRPEETLQ